MSDVSLMTALIKQHAKARVNGRFYDWTDVYPNEGGALKAAEALYEAGFRLMTDETDKAQNARLDEHERRLARLEGWAGLPQ